MTDYQTFLASKLALAPPEGLDLDVDLHEALFPFQAEIVRWALRRGRCAVFASCGLGKTIIALEWAKHVMAHAGRVLILAPLAVAQQTVREAGRFGYSAAYARNEGEAGDGIVVTNYERLDAFDTDTYAGIVLDESSILKSFMGTRKRQIIAAFRETPYRLCCSATPAPNDHMELGNHSDFLGVMDSHKMLSRWFINDTSTFGTYRLKGHAVVPFWDWVASWAMCVDAPSEMGYSDDGFILPPLRLHQQILDVDVIEGRMDTLFRMPDLSATSIHREKRRTAPDRAAKVAELVAAEPDETWLIWCETEYEAKELRAVIPDAVEVRGSHKSSFKESAALWFTGAYEEECQCQRRSSVGNTTAATTRRTKASTSAPGPSKRSTTRRGARSMPATPNTAKIASDSHANGSGTTQGSDSQTDSAPTDSRPTNISESSNGKEAVAPSADETTRTTAAEHGSMSTTATSQGGCEGSSARRVTSGSESSEMIPAVSSGPPCTCGKLTAERRRILLSKSSIFGWGLNFQHCARVAFIGATFSYESFYQAVRRCWRFGQKRPVDVHVVMAQTERSIWATLTAKRDGHDNMREQMSAAMVRARAKEAARESYQPTVPMRIPSWLATEVTL